VVIVANSNHPGKRVFEDGLDGGGGGWWQKVLMVVLWQKVAMANNNHP
jgi:hypothetical protein